MIDLYKHTTYSNEADQAIELLDNLYNQDNLDGIELF